MRPLFKSFRSAEAVKAKLQSEEEMKAFDRSHNPEKYVRVLQCVAVQSVAVCCSVLQCVAMQGVAGCCSVLQCVALCGTVLQRESVACTSYVTRIYESCHANQ